jgi:hypothetical protein
MGLESMGYLLPRAAIVLIAWGTTSLVMNFWTGVSPQVFDLAAGIWAFVGLVSFSYMQRLERTAEAHPDIALAPIKIPAE